MLLVHILKQNIGIEEKIKLCDLVTEYIQYQYSKEQIEKKEYVRFFMEILNTRSKLGKPDENRYKIPVPAQPEEGHKSNRFSIGGGMKGEDLFQELRLRAAYHDLLDPDDGYIKGSQIQFCNVVLRYYYYDKKLKLKNLDFVDIFSLSPWDKFFKPISWKIRTGLTQKDFSDEKDHLIFQLNPGGGFAYEFRFVGICFIMMETDIDLSRKFEDKYAAGIGSSMGLLNNLTNFWKIHLFTRNLYYGLGDKHKSFELALLQRFKLTTNNSLTFEFSWRKVFDFCHKEIILNYNLFF